MDRIKKLKIKQQDGTFSDYIPIGADAENIDTTDGESVQLKLNKKPYYYNSVADMKADNKLKVGDMATTLGYYSANDGGGAEYKIRNITNDDIVDNAFIIPLNNTNLIAEIIPFSNTINPLQLGCTSDSGFDSSPVLQKALNKNLVINGNNKTFNVKTSLNLLENSSIEKCVFTGNSELNFINSDTTPYLNIKNCKFINFNKALNISCYYSNFDNIDFYNCSDGLYFINGSATGTLVENTIRNIKGHNCERLIYTSDGNKITDMLIDNIIVMGKENNTKNLLHFSNCAGFNVNNVHLYGSCNIGLFATGVFKSNFNNIYIEDYSTSAIYTSIQSSCNFNNLNINSKLNKNIIHCDKASYNIDPCVLNLSNVNIIGSDAPSNIVYSGTSPIVNITNINYPNNFKLNGVYLSNNLKVFTYPNKINDDKQISINGVIIKGNTNLNITGAEKSITLPFNIYAYGQRLLHAKFTYISYLGGTTANTIESDIIVSRVNENTTNIVKTNTDMPISITYDKENKQITLTYTPSDNSQYGVLDINY